MIVQLRDVFRVFPGPDGGVAALAGLSLDVAGGEIVAVLGPSGSGKTTLLRLLAGLERPSAGSARAAGHDLATLRGRALDRYRAGLGFADQHYHRALEPGLAARELVGLRLALAGAPRTEWERRADELLERAGLADRVDARPAELSGGEQQRLVLCAALAHRPRLLLADEPTGELDAAAAAAANGLLAELVRDEGATAIVVSHDPATAAVADRVVHIRDGRVSEEAAGAGATVVVGRGGWLRVPEELLRAAGIDGRAHVAARPGAVELTPAAGAARAEPSGRAPRSPAPARPGVTVETHGVSRAYGGEIALPELDARFALGRLTAVTGPSGSGKSTLLRLLAGLERPSAGAVLVDGTELSALGRAARAAFRRGRIAVVGQTPVLSEFLDAQETVELALAVRGVHGEEARRRAAEALAAVGLAEHLRRPVGRLSGGQRTRVALARALAARPVLLVADEPTARLDAATTAAIGALLADLAHRTGVTVVCATHDPLLVEQADAELRLGLPRWPSSPTPSRSPGSAASGA